VVTRRAVRTYLEMTDRSQLAGADAPAPGVTVERLEPCPPALYRQLYADVGREYHWVDRLEWTDEEIARHLAEPGLEFWLLNENDTAAGYFELWRCEDGAIQIGYFGLLPHAVGRGLGKFMLTRAIERAWDLGAKRVWLHTSSLDHASALPNYLGRGFSIWKQETYDY
jgi:GNAT superfamily N-acetyltransferase